MVCQMIYLGVSLGSGELSPLHYDETPSPVTIRTTIYVRRFTLDR